MFKKLREEKAIFGCYGTASRYRICLYLVALEIQLLLEDDPDL